MFRKENWRSKCWRSRFTDKVFKPIKLPKILGNIECKSRRFTDKVRSANRIVKGYLRKRAEQGNSMNKFHKFTSRLKSEWLQAANVVQSWNKKLILSKMMCNSIEKYLLFSSTNVSEFYNGLESMLKKYIFTYNRKLNFNKTGITFRDIEGFKHKRNKSFYTQLSYWSIK